MGSESELTVGSGELSILQAVVTYVVFKRVKTVKGSDLTYYNIAIRF